MIVACSPLRISFAGGGSDFREFHKLGFQGACLSAAINKYVYVCINQSFDSRVRIAYSRTELVNSVAEVQHELIREALSMWGITDGVEVVTIADVPSSGTGLGSSSALAVGLMKGLSIYVKHEPLSNQAAAQMACELEIDRLHKPIGEQDQYGCAIGGVKLIEWRQSVKVSKVDCPELGQWLLLFYIGTSRGSDAILQEQANNIVDRQFELWQLAGLAREAYKQLKAGDYTTLGKHVNHGWHIKKTLAGGISDMGIDKLCERAINQGAQGAKVAGAGGGGFLLVIAQPSSHYAIKKHFTDLRHIPFEIDLEGAKLL